VSASVLLASALVRPFWSFTLYAPQYPKGLRLEVWLDRVTGDVREIDVLNHYIGMASLSAAAPLERALAEHAVHAFVVLALIGALVRPRWLVLVLSAPLITFPLAFIADCLYWLHRFGHDLDPRAPIELPPFTPTLFGNGVIGQFMTFAQPGIGFWMATGAAVIAGLGTALAFRGERWWPGRKESA